MLTSDSKRKLAAIGMFALPIAIVKIAAGVLGGPSGAQAQGTLSVAPPPAPNATRPAVEITRREQIALAHIARLDETAFGPTPMLHARAGGPVIGPEPRDPGVPRFRVNAIMVSSSGNKALIDGRSLEVGDTIAGWTIIDINGVTRAVTIQDPETGRIAAGSVQRPGLD